MAIQGIQCKLQNSGRERTHAYRKRKSRSRRSSLVFPPVSSLTRPPILSTRPWSITVLLTSPTLVTLTVSVWSTSTTSKSFVAISGKTIQSITIICSCVTLPFILVPTTSNLAVISPLSFLPTFSVPMTTMSLKALMSCLAWLTSVILPRVGIIVWVFKLNTDVVVDREQHSFCCLGFR